MLLLTDVVSHVAVRSAHEIAAGDQISLSLASNAHASLCHIDCRKLFDMLFSSMHLSV